MSRAAAALEALASAPPSSLSTPSSLQTLHAVLCEAGLARPAESDVARLHALFDVALKSNLVSVIIDFVVEVCLDPDHVSSDPAAAFLVDGLVVATWAVGSGASLGGAAQQLQNIIFNTAATKEALPKLCAAACALADLCRVAAALQPKNTGASPSTRALAHLPLLAAHAAALAWVARCQPGLPRVTGVGAWAAAVSARRAAAAPHSSCLDTLCAAAGRPPCTATSYEAAAMHVFSGAAADTAPSELVAARSHLFAYYLLDAAPQGRTHAFDSYVSSCGVGAADAARIAAGFALDEFSSARACALLPATATVQPLAALQRLAALPDCGAAAVSALRGRGPPCSLDEAAALVDARLRSNDLFGAFDDLSGYVSAASLASPGAGEEAASALLPAVCSAAFQSRCVPLLLSLPWGFAEERAIALWLQAEAPTNDAAAAALPALFLCRGRLVEAAAAHALVAGAGSEAMRATRTALLSDLILSLPDAQKNLVLCDGGNAGDTSDTSVPPVSIVADEAGTEATLAAAVTGARSACGWAVRAHAVADNPHPLLLSPIVLAHEQAKAHRPVPDPAHEEDDDTGMEAEPTGDFTLQLKVNAAVSSPFVAPADRRVESPAAGPSDSPAASPHNSPGGASVSLLFGRVARDGPAAVSIGKKARHSDHP